MDQVEISTDVLFKIMGRWLPDEEIVYDTMGKIARQCPDVAENSHVVRIAAARGKAGADDVAAAVAARKKLPATYRMGPPEKPVAVKLLRQQPTPDIVEQIRKLQRDRKFGEPGR